VLEVRLRGLYVLMKFLEVAAFRGKQMENQKLGKVVSDGDELLIVLSDDFVREYKIVEGDELYPIIVEAGKLTL
jgi:hypothetical protein